MKPELCMFVLVHQGRVCSLLPELTALFLGLLGNYFQCHILCRTVIHCHDSSSSPWAERTGHFYVCLSYYQHSADSGLTDAPAVIDTTWHVRHPLLKVSVALVSLITNFDALIPNIYVHNLNTSLNGWQRSTLVYGYLYINTGSPSFNPPTHSSSSSVSCHQIQLPLRITVYVLLLLLLQANAFTTVQCVMTRETKHKKEKEMEWGLVSFDTWTAG